MKKNFKQVYQFKISLLEIKPTIWRRIQVPDTYAFSELHSTIQRAMGWYDCHLYEFSMALGGIIPENDLIRNIFYLGTDADSLSGNNKVSYEYDFGDSWLHEILLEKVLPAKPDVQYPICMAGKRSCPPEDCGGVPGYHNLLRIIKNPEHKDYDSMMGWLGRKFHPEKFDLHEIYFPDK